MQKKIIFLIILTSLWLISVLSFGGTKNIKDTDELEKNEGILLSNVSSNDNDIFILFESNENTTAESEILEINNELKVVPLAAGEYQIFEVRKNNNYARFRRLYNFTIEKNKITYIGDIGVKSTDEKVNAMVFDKSNKVKTMLEKQYPNIYKKYEFINKAPKKPFGFFKENIQVL